VTAPGFAFLQEPLLARAPVGRPCQKSQASSSGKDDPGSGSNKQPSRLDFKPTCPATVSSDIELQLSSMTATATSCTHPSCCVRCFFCLP
jgi:hypothetical protein